MLCRFNKKIRADRGILKNVVCMDIDVHSECYIRI